MKTYRGARLNGKCTVKVYDDKKGAIKEITPHVAQLLASVRDLLEDEQKATFEWGNTGRGAYLLGLSLILDATGDTNASLDLVQSFVQQFVACWGSTWSVTDSEIFAWSAGGAPRWASWQG